MSEGAYRICKVAIMLGFLAVFVWIGMSYKTYVQHTRYMRMNKIECMDTEEGTVLEPRER